MQNETRSARGQRYRNNQADIILEPGTAEGDVLQYDATLGRYENRTVDYYHGTRSADAVTINGSNPLIWTDVAARGIAQGAGPNGVLTVTNAGIYELDAQWECVTNAVPDTTVLGCTVEVTGVADAPSTRTWDEAYTGSQQKFLTLHTVLNLAAGATVEVIPTQTSAGAAATNSISVGSISLKRVLV